MNSGAFTHTAKSAGLQIELNKPLAPFTNWKIGGPARWFAELKNSAQIKTAIALANKYEIPLFVLGGGTNILVSDSGFKGLVIKIATADIKKEGEVVWADAGVSMGRLTVFCLRNGLSGLEWAVGVPGTVGGAVFGNSNCFGGSTAENFLKGELLNSQGDITIRDKSYFEFAYDYSKLQETGEILLKAAFKLSSPTKAMVSNKQKEIAESARQRAQQQPLGKKTAGSTFKAIRPTTETRDKILKFCREGEIGERDGLISAGFIIDKCLGLKGLEMAGMKISEKHANFFLNLGQAKAAGAKELIDFVKEECKNKLDIELEEEIKYVGKF